MSTLPDHDNFDFGKPQLGRYHLNLQGSRLPSYNYTSLNVSGKVPDYLLSEIAVSLGADGKSHLVAANTVGTNILYLEYSASNTTSQLTLLLLSLIHI